MMKKIENSYVQEFGNRPSHFVRSPGRINLIGEHTDYNLGFVMPAAIDKSIFFAFGLRQDHEIHFHAIDLNERFVTEVFNAQTQYLKPQQQWTHYLLGILEQLQKRGTSIQGFNCSFASNLPQGAGLSSSAALECGLIFGLNDLFSLNLSSIEMTLMGQAAENQFVGVNCGIMDQFANIHGKRDHLIKLDCRDYSFELLPFELTDHQLVLCDTNVKHNLASSEYNLRRAECEAGVLALKNRFPEINSLRDSSMQQLHALEKEISELTFKRCSYVIGEINRVKLACEDLRKGDLESFGNKMFQTHAGLSQEYEVSCEELDFLVREATSLGATGARMMGGGFGGCTINLIEKDKAKRFKEQLQIRYPLKFGRELMFYEVSLSDGTQRFTPNSNTV
jgi:galactokinase